MPSTSARIEDTVSVELERLGLQFAELLVSRHPFPWRLDNDSEGSRVYDSRGVEVISAHGEGARLLVELGARSVCSLWHQPLINDVVRR